MTHTRDHTRWSLVLIATIAGFAAALNVGKVSPTLSLLQQELALSLLQMGWVVSSYSGLVMLIAVPVGLLSAKAGHYRLTLLGLVLLGGGALTSTYAADIVVLLAARITEGLGYVMVAIAAPALITQVVNPKDRAMAMGIWATWMPVGICIMLLSAPTIIAASGWRNVWLLAGVFPLLWLCVVAFSFRGMQRTTPNPNSRALADIRGILHRAPLLIMAAFACFSALFLVAATFPITAWHQLKGISLQHGSYLLTFAIILNICGNLIGGALIARGLALSRVLAISFTLPALLAGLTFVETLPFWLQYVCLASFFFFGGIVPGAIFAAAPAYATSPAQIGLLIGLFFQGAATGQVIGPIVFSTLIELANGNWAWGAAFYGFFGLLGGLVMINIPPPQSTETAI